MMFGPTGSRQRVNELRVVAIIQADLELSGGNGIVLAADVKNASALRQCDVREGAA